MLFDDILEQLSSTDAVAAASACERLVDIVQERELTPDEIAQGAEHIAASGAIMLIPSSEGGVADVPSSGAPGSLSTLLCPYLLVACGIRVPKISASGSVAGGIDTLGLLPGFKTMLEEREALELLDKVGTFHTQQSPQLCPTDGLLIGVRRKREMMANPSLAAMSLLSKKIAVPGTRVVLDFRVGIEGNIGADFLTASHAARLLLAAAKTLKISIVVALTDNRSSPTTALGRLESLRLLLAALTGPPNEETNRRHVAVCVGLAARAVALARGEQFSEQHVSEVQGRLKDGYAMSAFRDHVTAQGVDVDVEDFVTAELRRQIVTVVHAKESGTWFPPSLTVLKRFAKGASSAGDPCVGYRALIEPGSIVDVGQPVAELRGNVMRTISPELTGLVVHQYKDLEFIE